MILRAYQVFVWLCTPLLLAWDTWRAWKNPIYRPHRAERWGFYVTTLLKSKQIQHCVWIHAVSVGETQAAATLLRGLLQQNPHTHILLTHMTPTGRDTGAALFAAEIAAGRVLQCYLPYDHPVCVLRFLTVFKPTLGIIMETELWPSLITMAASGVATRGGVKMCLVNARLSAKSAKGMARFAALSRRVWGDFACIAAQTQADADRMAAFLPKLDMLHITGNLKFDAVLNQAQWKAGRDFRQSYFEKTGKLIVCLASTREGEEAILLDALRPLLHQIPCPVQLLLVPRHPVRAEEIKSLLNTRGCTLAQKSAEQPFEALDKTLGENLDEMPHVWLGDTLGEMAHYYGMADIVIMGGGWLPLGGQNLIEPCAAGCATIIGPSQYNFMQVAEWARNAGAVLSVDSINDLSSKVDLLLKDEILRLHYAQAGQTFAATHTGATSKTLALLRALA